MQVSNEILAVWNKRLQRGDIAIIRASAKDAGLKISRQWISHAIKTGDCSEKIAKIINEFFAQKKRNGQTHEQINASMKEALDNE